MKEFRVLGLRKNEGELAKNTKYRVSEQSSLGVGCLDNEFLVGLCFFVAKSENGWLVVYQEQSNQQLVSLQEQRKTKKQGQRSAYLYV